MFRPVSITSLFVTAGPNCPSPVPDWSHLSPVLSSSLSDCLLFTLMCLLCFPVVPSLGFEVRLDFWLLLEVLFILLMISTDQFWCQISCQRLHSWQFSFIMLDLHDCQTVVDYSCFHSWSKPKPYVVHIQPDVLCHKKLSPNMKQSRTAVNPESGNTLKSHQLSFILGVSPGSLWYKFRHQWAWGSMCPIIYIKTTGMPKYA